MPDPPVSLFADSVTLDKSACWVADSMGAPTHTCHNFRVVSPPPPRIVPGNYAAGAGPARRRFGDGTPEFREASGPGHHMVLGPGADLEAQWQADGLALPDLASIRDHRLARVRRQLELHGYDGILVMDPLNIRYVTDTTNMQVWVMHNAARYAFLAADGPIILWDYTGCEFLAGPNPHVFEVRPAVGSTYFLAGGRNAERAETWADDLASVIAEHCGPDARIAVDQVNYLEGTLLAGHGITIERGQEVMELARSIKNEAELDALRCAGHACAATMAEMQERLAPGQTEREVWAMLHEGNIRRGGEWIETQLLASGPRTNPWFQEVSSRVLESGDIIAYDTDLVGAYGMCIDVSRTWLVGGGKPTPPQRTVYDLAREQIDRNIEMLRPGVTFRELTFDSWKPDPDEYRHYSCLFHGVGQCDEWPSVYFPSVWDRAGYDGVLEAGMVMTVESYVGSRTGGEGVKLEEQVVVTDRGPELLFNYPLELS